MQTRPGIDPITSPVTFMQVQLRVIGALIMREIVTRYGREGLGFLWLIGEPLLFCLGVIVLWSAMKPAYEHGIRLGPFVMTGYMSLLLLRHLVTHSLNAMQANAGLMYHRVISPLHIFISRFVLEIAGTTAAFVVVYAILFSLGEVGLPKEPLLLYGGWLILAWLSMGLALMIAALAIRFETVERLAQLFMYLLIPLSGAFFMISFLPPAIQKFMLWVPLPHAVEMIRAGIFGEFVETHYNFAYPIVWGAFFNVAGLLMLRLFREHVEVE